MPGSVVLTHLPSHVLQHLRQRHLLQQQRRPACVP
jgi:hypothetical protein